MPVIPNTDETPLIRTDFSDEVAWMQLVDAVKNPSDDGFLANLHIISDREFEEIAADALACSAVDTSHAILFVADKSTMTHVERPILCVDVLAPERTFRVIPSELWGPENNLSLANMDFAEFADNAGSDGIFRGF